jgi:tRNA(Phe) wybutosine-synthesizing methylase Tyw3
MKADWKKQAKEILKMAKEAGVKSNFLFSTTFERYMTQLECLERLKERLDTEDLIIEKEEYSKNCKNSYANPALSEFNKTTDSANKSASTLIRIISTFIPGNDGLEEDPLAKILNGESDDEDN